MSLCHLLLKFTAETRWNILVWISKFKQYLHFVGHR